MGTKLKKAVRKKKRADTSSLTAAGKIVRARRKRQIAAVGASATGAEKAAIARTFLKKNQGKRKKK